MARTRAAADPGIVIRGTGSLGSGTPALAGPVGGLCGAAAMSLFRLGLHRAGLIDKMVPQAVEEWLSDRLNTDPPGGKAGHDTADQLLHLAYRASLGALAGPILSGRRASGGLWREGLWPGELGFRNAGSGAGSRVARPAWRAGPLENATNIAAHLVFGVAIQLFVEEPVRQRNRTRTSDAERMGNRMG